MKCCLCGKENIGHGHNAAPIKDGRCCCKCQQDVMRQRLHDMQNIPGWSIDDMQTGEPRTGKKENEKE